MYFNICSDDANRYPFILRLVDTTHIRCGKCDWTRLCIGCVLPLNDSPVELRPVGVRLAIDWDTTALHLRYQHTAEMSFEDDESTEITRKLHYEPCTLYSCLQHFTNVEHMGNDEAVMCKKCERKQTHTIKVDIWNAPEVLVSTRIYY